VLARLRRSLDILVQITIDNDIKLIKSDMQLPQLAGLWPGTSPAVTRHACGILLMPLGASRYLTKAAIHAAVSLLFSALLVSAI